MTPVTCTVCKAPFQVFGVEPPLEYVCAACTDPSGGRAVPGATAEGIANYYNECGPPVADEVSEGLGGPPVLSPLEERVAALERFAAEVGPLVEGLSHAVAAMGGSFS